MTVGLFLGILVTNLRPDTRLDAGARLARSWFLPLGNVLLGARLSLGDILSTGLGAIAGAGGRHHPRGGVMLAVVSLALFVALGIG